MVLHTSHAGLRVLSSAAMKPAEQFLLQNDLVHWYKCTALCQSTIHGVRYSTSTASAVYRPMVYQPAYIPMYV